MGEKRKIVLLLAAVGLALTACGGGSGYIDYSDQQQQYQQDYQDAQIDQYAQDYEAEIEQYQQDAYEDDLITQCMDENWAEAYDEDYSYEWCSENAQDYAIDNYAPDEYYDQYDYEPDYDEYDTQGRW